MKRGGRWEWLLEQRHDEYRRNEKAWIAKSNPSVKVVNGKPLFAGKGAPDYFGVLEPSLFDGPLAVAFDAKSTEQPTWSFHLLELHQAKDLEAVMQRRGISFLAIQFPTTTRLVFWGELREQWWAWWESYRPGARMPVPKLDGAALRREIIDGTDWLTTLQREFR